MNLVFRSKLCLVSLSLVLAIRLPAATTEAIDFKEIYELLGKHLTGVDDAALNRAAVEGLLKELKPRVALVAGGTVPSPTNSPALAAKAVFDGSIAYLRIAQVAAGLDKDFASAYAGLASSNRLKGIVLDLRFADGTDYAAAAALADRFFTNETALIDWGEGLRKSTAKPDAIKLPVAILVNPKTTDAAEALAGILRQNEIGLLIGTNTAGQASISKEFTLKTGQRVRVAVAPVKVAGGEAMPPTGLKSDIRVEVSPDDDRAWYKNAYRVPPRSTTLAGADGSTTNEITTASTNRMPRRRINEADLVRMQREGQAPDDLTNVTVRDLEPARPVVRDPALVRAIDLLKGLSVMQRFRSP